MKQGTATIIEAEPAELTASDELRAVGNFVLVGNDRPFKIHDSHSRSRFHAAADGLGIELSVVIPCLNEAQAIGKRVRQALEVLREAGVAGEVIVADNGSTDGSAEIAEAEGARVVRVAQRGYGSAIMSGIGAARGEYVLMADADESHDLTHIPRFLAELRTGQDLVMGNRFRGGIAKGAMPFLHRYLGNPVLTGLGKLFFKSSAAIFTAGFGGSGGKAIGDWICGRRGWSLPARWWSRRPCCG